MYLHAHCTYIHVYTMCTICPWTCTYMYMYLRHNNLYTFKCTVYIHSYRVETLCPALGSHNLMGC